jgi:predicted ArsR family transcriptional regulator
VWDYCSASASLFFGTSTGDHTADRILEAINPSTSGLSRTQMSALFHGHVSSNRIDAALEQLISLGAIVQSNQPTGGRPATLWSATAEAQSMGGEETADESATEDATNEESMQEQTKFA